MMGIHQIKAKLSELVEAGVVTPPRLDAADWTWQPKPLGMPEGTALDLLDELRSEGATRIG